VGLPKPPILGRARCGQDLRRAREGNRARCAADPGEVRRAVGCAGSGCLRPAGCSPAAGRSGDALLPASSGWKFLRVSVSSARVPGRERRAGLVLGQAPWRGCPGARSAASAPNPPVAVTKPRPRGGGRAGAASPPLLSFVFSA